MLLLLVCYVVYTHLHNSVQSSLNPKSIMPTPYNQNIALYFASCSNHHRYFVFQWILLHRWIFSMLRFICVLCCTRIAEQKRILPFHNSKNHVTGKQVHAITLIQIHPRCLFGICVRWVSDSGKTLISIFDGIEPQQKQQSWCEFITRIHINKCVYALETIQFAMYSHAPVYNIDTVDTVVALSLDFFFVVVSDICINFSSYYIARGICCNEWMTNGIFISEGSKINQRDLCAHLYGDVFVCDTHCVCVTCV